MITISFYSYKGGVGRSLALTNLAVYLTQFGAKVAMVDLDLEAPGLHYKLQPGKGPIEQTNPGVAALLARVSSGVPPSEADYDVDIDVTSYAKSDSSESILDQPEGRLLLLPAGDPLTTNYWRDVASIDWAKLFESPGRPGVSAMWRLRQRLIEKHDPDILLVDSRTGITASAGIATTLLPDVVVTFLLKTPEHLDGSRVVISSIVEARADNEAGPPRVVPVLSRYTSKAIQQDGGLADIPSTVRNARRAALDTWSELARSEEDPLEGIRSSLVQGLPTKLAAYLDEPLALHADLALQREECLAFGPHARDVERGEGGEALLDDYLRLFSNLVPKEIVTRYLSGVRNRVRAIILDRPDDAVKTLENLAALVGDEDVFIDLVKVYLLRRDTRSMVLAANKLFRVHGRIVVDSAITASLREILIGPMQRRTTSLPLEAGFVEAYWRAADAADLHFGAGVVRFLASRGLVARAEELAEDLLAVAPEARFLRLLVEMLAAGDDACERLAVKLATKHFALGRVSHEFLEAAATACHYQPDTALARLISEAPGFEALSPTSSIEVLRLAGRLEEAGIRAVEALTELDPYDPGAEAFVDVWFTLIARNRELRSELEGRNPGMVETLESLSHEQPARAGRTPYWR